MDRLLRARLEGPGAELGSVPAADVARVILGLQRVLADATYAVLRRRREATGRHPAVVEAASRLRLVDIERGSVVQILALPHDAGQAGADQLDVSVADLSRLALDRVLSAFSEADDAVDAALARSLAVLADDLGIGDRNERLVLEDDADGAARVVAIDAGVRARMRRIAEATPRAHADELAGTLVEADFEKLTARLQPAAGKPVSVSFGPELADDIYRALRGPAFLEGVVTYERRTRTAAEVRLRRVRRASQLGFDSDAFWTRRSVTELAEAQGVAPGDLADVYQVDLADEERAAFVAAVCG